MTLLFRLAEWHALAKLRMHTDHTLGIMDYVTIKLGQAARKFRSITCNAFVTRELESEARRRARRQGDKQAANNQCSASDTKTQPKAKSKGFNLHTYKYHALGDYVNTVRTFGTTDSYSTQLVSGRLDSPKRHAHCQLQGEREHRRVKRYYARTNKRQAIDQVVKLERREARLQRAKTAEANHSHHVSMAESDPLPYTIGEMHHHISDSRNHPLDLFSFGRKFPGDPATKVSLDAEQ
jgi:hypothetical protein